MATTSRSHSPVSFDFGPLPGFERPEHGQRALRLSYIDAEEAIEALVILGAEGGGCEATSAAVAFRAALQRVVERVAAHYEALGLDASLRRSHPAAGVLSRHLDYCQDLQRRNLAALTEVMRRNADEPAVLAQAVVIAGVVLLHDWQAHGRLLAVLTAPESGLTATRDGNDPIGGAA